MVFTSDSILMNRGINYKVIVRLPTIFSSYKITDEILDECIKSFNKELDARSQVSEIVNGVKVDVLRLKEMCDNIMLWMYVKENDLPKIKRINFSLAGLLVFTDATEREVERIIIEDLLYTTDQIIEPTSIFKKKKRKHESTSPH
jgi:hypothetical protein